MLTLDVTIRCTYIGTKYRLLYIITYSILYVLTNVITYVYTLSISLGYHALLHLSSTFLKYFC
jgi:hypothetical protein